ncbi:hypothetical protein BJ741DRAFT_649541 [Chytriomyces cf. hyalinus JEL632]|nr:hypothetical protein BJ741DRAFT_649541 [Chytriomyces cf. hyalinus JEL632]
MMLAEASIIISAKWRNLTIEQRAVYEARAKEANANPLQLVNDLDIEKKIELSNNALSQLKKCFGVLDALGYSFMFAAINEDTNATFKQITGTPAKIADDQYKKSGDGIGFANASLSAGGKDASSWYSSRAMNKSPPATRPGT